jgi:hypothetical protein
MTFALWFVILPVTKDYIINMQSEGVSSRVHYIYN